MFRKDKGKCGKSIRWHLESPCELVLEGSGEMYDMPWGNVEKEKTLDFCRKIVSVKMSDAITSIGKYGFAAFTNLSYFNLPQSLVLIDDFAFAYCMRIQYLAVPQRVQLIGQYAFQNCSDLEIIKIPYRTTISGEAFCQCDKVKIMFV